MRATNFLCNPKTASRLRSVVVLALVLGTAACSPYRLRGIVITGPEPGIEIVGQDDPRLEAVGLASTQIEVVLDPDRFNPKKIGKGLAGRNGDFAVEVTESGAGFMILDVEVVAQRDNYQTVKERFELPGANKRLVVTMRPGQDLPKPAGEDFLKETLRDAEPYLRDAEPYRRD